MPDFTYPELPLDALLRRAAVRDPGGCAVRAPGGAVTFAELDDRADRIATYLEHRLGRRGARVGIANVLDAGFAAAYYGTVRSGNTVVLLNPLITVQGLVHVCCAARVEVALVPRTTAGLLGAAREQLPALTEIVVTDAPDEVVPADTVPLAAALHRTPAATRRPAGPAGDRVNLDADACIQFTTGTTGRPRGVRLSHRNLVANAAQTAHAHGLGSDSTTLNHLPLYHVMHLNSAVYAGAHQVLCPDPDPLAALRLAARTGTTHFYGLPARLHQLAATVRPPDTNPPAPANPPDRPHGLRLTAVLSGGSALSPAATRDLHNWLGVPVVQGYGMAELSPLTHSQDFRHPVPGSVGTPVAGTDCRIVDLTTRAPTSAHTTGEVQVRGPQLMTGYLDEDDTAPVDPQGWFSTGDIGYLNQDGVLFLVDRIGDVFKHDNELVSPTAIERILTQDPRVAECVVVDWPDPVHGSVTWAGIVPAGATPTAPPGPCTSDLPALLDSIVTHANQRLAPFEQIRRVEALDAVPRTPVGKPARQALRRTLHARAAAESATAPSTHPNQPTPTTRGATTMVTFVNKLTVHGDINAFLAAKDRITTYMSAQPGHVAHRTLHSLTEPHVFLEVADWENPDAHQAAVRSDGFRALVGALAAHATPEPGLYETLPEGARLESATTADA
ncbi:AMP-binding protein [Streptomyces sp. NPDC059851]|uniref:AMP-binding protein n=1 Tax=Streptomyces sp. NPDC059851 TaxID=3346971 RepID=UPI0036506F9D